MIKWLLLSALAVNCLAYFWFTAQDGVDLTRRANEVYWQDYLAGEVVLLSELQVIPPMRAHIDDQAAKVDRTDGFPVPGSSLEVVASANVSQGSGKGGGVTLETSQMKSGGDGFREGIVDAEALIESKPGSKPESGLRCALLGRFDNKKDLDGLMQKLRKEAGVIARVNMVKEGLERYLVYMPPFEAREAAKQQQATLRKDGVRSSLYYKGALKNGLSLGYFASVSNANRRHDKLIAAGYNVELKTVVTEITRYWIELGEKELASLSELFWQDMTKEFPNVARKEVECSAI